MKQTRKLTKSREKSLLQRAEILLICSSCLFKLKELAKIYLYMLLEKFMLYQPEAF